MHDGLMSTLCVKHSIPVTSSQPVISVYFKLLLTLTCQGDFSQGGRKLQSCQKISTAAALSLASVAVLGTVNVKSDLLNDFGHFFLELWNFRTSELKNKQQDMSESKIMSKVLIRRNSERHSFFSSGG